MRGKFGWGLPPGVTDRMIEEQAGAFEDDPNHEPEPPAWAREWIRGIRKEQPVMTPEEKREAGLGLGQIILKFLNAIPFTNNQEAVEVLGIAVMFFHSLLYAMNYPDPQEKP